MGAEIVTSIEVTSDVVEVTKLITSAVVALAWPVVFLTIAFLFRPYIAEIIGRATGIEWGNLRVAFERRLENAEQRAETIPDMEEGEAAVQITPADESLPPDYLVIDYWRRIEAELLRISQLSGISPTRGSSALYMTRVLRRNGVIDSSTSALLDDLRALRNAAVHSRGETVITVDQARRFRTLAELVLATLQRLPAEAPAV